MSHPSNFPRIIQGGMGVGVSGWPLARAVATAGQMGVVSGTGLDTLMVRRLQLEGLEGATARALRAFPFSDLAAPVLDRFGASARPPGAAFRLAPLPDVAMSPYAESLIVMANFAEVFLAKEGHDGLVGVNYLEKIQVPTLPALFGAMLAGVDAVLMGAGLPLAVPGILDRLARWEPVTLNLAVEGGDPVVLRFDPGAYRPHGTAGLKRPAFIGIVSSEAAAKILVRKSTGAVDGLVVEHHTAGGHNAPPRRNGEPGSGYGPRDEADLDAVRALGVPFWLAGGCASPERLAAARAAGAMGIQVGTAFAFCGESGIMPELRAEVLSAWSGGTLRIETDYHASPTGYPFKVVHSPRLDQDLNAPRKRVCDLGQLRQAYRRPDGTTGFRCPGEPVAEYVRKGGKAEDTDGKRCLCNSLLATIGLGQRRPAGAEPPLVTAGDDFSFLSALRLDPSAPAYSARAVLDYLLADAP